MEELYAPDVDWTNARSVCGAPLASFFAASLQRRGLAEKEFPSLSRAMARWREPGTQVSIWTVDKWCCALWMHYSMVPAECWSLEPVKRGNPENLRNFLSERCAA